MGFVLHLFFSQNIVINLTAGDDHSIVEFIDLTKDPEVIDSCSSSPGTSTKPDYIHMVLCASYFNFSITYHQFANTNVLLDIWSYYVLFYRDLLVLEDVKKIK